MPHPVADLSVPAVYLPPCRERYVRTIEDRASASWSDEQLVAAARGGDVEAFAAIYDRYADALFNACYRQLGNRDEAADVVQDTFVLVNERLDQLRDASRLKSWLYAIATRESLRLVRARARSTPTDEFGDIADHEASPEEQAERSDLAVLLRTAAEGLSPTERSVLGLHLSGLSRPEIAEAVGLKVEAVHVCLHRLRGQVELSLGALLILRRGRRDCDGLASAVGRWDGRFSPRIRKRVVRHVRDCEACESRRARLLTPEALLGLIPWFAAPEDVRARVLDAARQIAALFANDPAAVHQPPVGGPPPAVQVSRVPPDASQPAPPATAPAGVGMVARLSVAATVVALLLGVGAMRIGRAPIEPEQVNPVAERAEPPAEVVTASAPPAGQSSGLRSELAGNGDQTTTGSGERRSTPGERAAAQLLPAGRASLAASAPVDTGNLNLDLSVPAEQAGVGGATLALDTTGKPTTVALASGPGPVTEPGTGAANAPTVTGDAQVPGAGVAQEQAAVANPAANPVLTAPAPNPQPAAPTVNAQPPAPLPVAPTAPAPNGNNTVTLQRQPAPSPGPQANVTPDEEEQQVEVLAQPPAPPTDADVNTNVNPNPNVEQPNPLPLPVPVDEAEQQVRAQPKAPHHRAEVRRRRRAGTESEECARRERGARRHAQRC